MAELLLGLLVVAFWCATLLPGLALLFVILALAYTQRSSRRRPLEARGGPQFRLSDLMVLVANAALVLAALRSAMPDEGFNLPAIALLVAGACISTAIWALGMLFLAIADVQLAARRAVFLLVLPLGAVAAPLCCPLCLYCAFALMGAAGPTGTPIERDTLVSLLLPIVDLTAIVATAVVAVWSVQNPALTPRRVMLPSPARKTAVQKRLAARRSLVNQTGPKTSIM
jgi:hypothetical protein